MGWLRTYFWFGLLLIAAGFALLALAVTSHFRPMNWFSDPPYLAGLTLATAGSMLVAVGRAARRHRE